MVEIFVAAVEQKVSCVDSLHLYPKSREVSVHVAGYIVAKMKETCGTFCKACVKKNEKKVKGT